MLQAERLGQHLAKRGFRFTHFFSSYLQRANKTAKAIRNCQPHHSEDPEKKLHVTRLETLQEQDFGFYEGKPFYARPANSTKSGMNYHRSQHSSEPGFQDIESKQSMSARADSFVHENLLPIICKDLGPKEITVAVVSHGVILGYVWRSILKLFAHRTVSLAPGLSVGETAGSTALESLGRFSNTGYLELDIQPVITAEDPAASESSNKKISTKTDVLTLYPGLRMAVKAVNSKEHLQGLKRTRGISSGKHDEGQKRIEAFFQKSEKKIDNKTDILNGKKVGKNSVKKNDNSNNRSEGG